MKEWGYECFCGEDGYDYGGDGESLVALKLLDYEKLYEFIGKRVPKFDASIMDLLCEYGFVRDMSGCLCITDMGALLFARNLKDFKHLQFRGLILRKYEGNSNLIMSAEKCSESGYMVEFDEFLDWIVNNTSREHIVVRREKLAMYPKVAIREFLANQIVHQSFEVAGMQLAVEIYDNRYATCVPYYA